MKTLTRLHQLLLVLAILSGCYEPELHDCTVTCGTGDECAAGQVCSKGFCVAEGASCTDSPPSMLTDAGMSADTADRVFVRVRIKEVGKIEIPGAGTCGANGERECFVPVDRGLVTATAMATESMHPFERWESGNCKDQPPTCTFTANGPTTIEAKFK